MKHIQQIVGWLILFALLFLVGKWLFTTPVGIIVLVALCIGIFFYYQQKKHKSQENQEKAKTISDTDQELIANIQSNKGSVSKHNQTQKISKGKNTEKSVTKNFKSQNSESKTSKLQEQEELKHVFDVQKSHLSESQKANLSKSISAFKEEKKEKAFKSKQKSSPIVKGPVTRFSITTNETNQENNTYSSEIAPGLYSTMTTVGSGRDMSRPRISNAPNSKNYIVLDTETTGLSTTHDRVIQLAALKFKDDKLIDTFNQYINPEGVPISEQARLVHGITEKEVYDKPKFSEIIPKFQKFVGKDTIWIGHNINGFDVPIMFNNGYRQKPDYKANDFWTIDTYLMAREEMAGLGLKNFKLETLKDYFDLHGNSHDALGDCQVTAALYQRLRDGNLAKVEKHPDMLLAGLRFCISGQFKEASQNELANIIALHGGKVTGGVSHKTDYLLDGRQVSTHLTDGKHSSSELKAMEYKTKIIHYQDLMKMLAKPN